MRRSVWRVPSDRHMPLTAHLEEVRRRLLVVLLALLVGMSASLVFATRLLGILERPLGGMQLHYTGPLDPMFVLLKISLAAGLVLSSPVVIYQLVAFVLPALTAAERRLLWSYLPAALFLFVAGLAFGFFAFVPLVLDFVFRLGGRELVPMVTVDGYTSFLIDFTLPFGLMFELPIAVMLLVRLGVLSYAKLRAGRKWAILAAAIIGAAFGPPDPVSTILTAAPVYVLYELSVLIAGLTERGKRRRPPTGNGVV